MKILIVHNTYQETGGEDFVASREAHLLIERENRVTEYQRHNDELRKQLGLAGTISAGITTVWSSHSYRAIEDILIRDKPDIAHFHNTFPLISPSAYYACEKAGVPVVQTLHNYRLLCPAATFFRDGKLCEECLGRMVPWPGVVHGCYRNSRLASSAVAVMLTVHRAMRTWQTKVDTYIALSEFARQKLIEGGLPAARIIVKPNFVSPDPKCKSHPGTYALFVGRLREEKGLRVLLDTWARLETPTSLRIAGDGPMRAEIARLLQEEKIERVELLGPVSHTEIIALMHGARFLLFPSIWYEGFPLAVVEAFACGLPVIASRLGTMSEIVDDGRTGLHFTPGDADDLAVQVEWAWNHPKEMEIMGRAARDEYETKYTSERNYKMLMDIYEGVIAGRQSNPRPPNSFGTLPQGVA
jgi:glycosyltransferase involved in cell wall biosynthesis